MSQENVEIVEGVWRAINRRDVEALLDLVTEDLDMRPPSYTLDAIGFRGHAGVREWMERVTTMWSEFNGSPGEVEVRGEHVVFAIDLHLIGRESGVPVNQRFFNVCTFRDDKVATSIAYPSKREALKAVGLEE